MLGRRVRRVLRVACGAHRESARERGRNGWRQSWSARTLVYVLSFGPACWLTDWGLMPDRGFGSTYTPVLACTAQSNTTSDAIVWYGKLLSPSWKTHGTTAGYLVYKAKDDWLPHGRRKSRASGINAIRPCALSIVHGAPQHTLRRQAIKITVTRICAVPCERVSWLRLFGLSNLATDRYTRVQSAMDCNFGQEGQIMEHALEKRYGLTASELLDAIDKRFRLRASAVEAPSPSFKWS